MNKNQKEKPYFYQTILTNHLWITIPSLISFGLFIYIINFTFIPDIKTRYIELKKESIHELTNTIWTLVGDYYRREQNGELSHEEAQDRAAKRIRNIRYGVKMMDYFWIQNTDPRIIVHPYIPELEGEYVGEYKDIAGNPIFKNFVQATENSEGSFSQYYWQLWDDPSRHGPKISFVKKFEPWGWIIGTGTYLNEINKEIDNMISHTTLYSAGVLGVILVLNFIIIFRSIKTENRRLAAEAALRENAFCFRTVSDFANDWIYWIDEKGNLIYMSPSCERITGYNSSQFVSDPSLIDRIVHPGDRLMVKEYMENEQTTRTPLIFDYRIITSAGEARWINHHSQPVFYSPGEFRGRRVSNRDITDRKKSEQEREELILQLRESISKVTKMSGLLPICARCKKIRDDRGYWEQLETYVMEHSEAEFTHSLCPECAKKLYPESFPDSGEDT